MIDHLTIDKIKSVARVKDVVSDFVTLRRSGPEWTAPCPFHGGRDLNHFKINEKKNLYFCFVCGEGGNAIDFLMSYQKMSYPDAIRWLGRKYSIFVDEEQEAPRFANIKKCEAKPIEQQPELPTLVLPVEMVMSRRDTSDDNLCNYIRELPWTPEQQRRVEPVLEAYAVGHSSRGGSEGMTIFWQIDETGQVRTGKMMRYLPKWDPDYGHRDKNKSGYTNDWIHAVLSRNGRTDLYNPEEQKMRPCLFGLHLLVPNSNCEDVNIVESEKTALIMSIAHGVKKGLWMATGGLQFLNRETLQPLIDAGKNIVLHPDHDGDLKWRKKMLDYGYVYGKDYQVNNFYVDIAWRESDGEKADCADIVVREMEESRRSKTIERLGDIIIRVPALKTMIDKLDLEVTSIAIAKQKE